MLLYGMLAKDHDESEMVGLREEIGMSELPLCDAAGGLWTSG